MLLGNERFDDPSDDYFMGTIAITHTVGCIDQIDNRTWFETVNVAGSTICMEIEIPYH